MTESLQPLQELPEPYREVIQLHCKGYSFYHISCMLQISLWDVWNLYYKGINAIPGSQTLT